HRAKVAKAIVRRLSRHRDRRVGEHCECIEKPAVLFAAIEAVADANPSRLGIDREPHLSAEASASEAMVFHIGVPRFESRTYPPQCARRSACLSSAGSRLESSTSDRKT